MYPRHSLIICCAALSACSSGVSTAGTRAEACDIALHYAQHFANKIQAYEPLAKRQIAVISAPQGLVPSQAELEIYSAQNPPVYDKDELALARRVIDAGVVSVLDECENVRRWTEDNAVLIDRERIDALSRGEDRPIVLLNLTMPTVSTDHSKGLVFISEYGGDLAGVSGSMTYEKGADGKWRIIDETMLSMS